MKEFTRKLRNFRVFMNFVVSRIFFSKNPKIGKILIFLTKSLIFGPQKWQTYQNGVEFYQEFIFDLKIWKIKTFCYWNFQFFTFMHFFQFLSHFCFLVQNWKLVKSSWYTYFLILHTFLLMYYVLKISFWWCFCQFVQFLTFWPAISPSSVENWNFRSKPFLFIFSSLTKN